MQRAGEEQGSLELDADEEHVSWRDRARANWVPGAIVVSALASPGLYWLLAEPAPSWALLLVTVATLAFFVLTTVAVWPTGKHITRSRTLEIWGYRAAAGGTAYVVLGYLVMLLVNAMTPRTIPTEFPDAIRFLPFWPFYVYFVIGCQGIGPCPPAPA